MQGAKREKMQSSLHPGTLLKFLSVLACPDEMTRRYPHERKGKLPVQMVKIKFQNPTHDAQGALELAKRFRVICLPEDTYEVPAVALAILDDLRLPYRILNA